MKILIGVVCGEFIQSSTVPCLLHLCLLLDQHKKNDVQLGTTLGSVATMNKNGLLKQAREYGADVLVLIDSDMVFAPADVARFVVEAFKRKQPVGANYFRRHGEFAGLAIDDAGKPVPYQGKTGLEPMRRGPIGLCAIPLCCFDKLDYKWFRDIFDNETGMMLGHDYEFTARLWEVGCPLLIDWDASQNTGHLGTFNYGPHNLKRRGNGDGDSSAG